MCLSTWSPAGGVNLGIGRTFENIAVLLRSLIAVKEYPDNFNENGFYLPCESETYFRGGMVLGALVINSSTYMCKLGPLFQRLHSLQKQHPQLETIYSLCGESFTFEPEEFPSLGEIAGIGGFSVWIYHDV